MGAARASRLLRALDDERNGLRQYRTVIGEWVDAYGRPLVIEDPGLTFINQTRIREGVGELESFVGKKGTLVSASADAAAMLNERLGVTVTSFRFAPSSVEQVLAAIRAQLVDRLIQAGAGVAAPLTSSISRQSDDILILKPSVWGLGIDLKAAWRRWRRRWR